MNQPHTTQTFFYTLFALLAFAGNSVLCRLALGEQNIDAASFTIIRLLAGIAVLLVIMLLTNKQRETHTSKGSWLSSAMLFLYAITFSFAYISLDTATGALILFGSVQITMIIFNALKGNKLHHFEWLGMSLAFIGFIYLVAPNLNTPSLNGFILMLFSGIAWAIYTLKGRTAENPITETSYNFVRTLPFVVILLLLTMSESHLTSQGVMLALLSGGLASGAGYAVWYAALKGLTITQAAVVQLLVPIIAALGGVIFTDEVIGVRLTLSAMMILGGICIVITGKYLISKAVAKS